VPEISLPMSGVCPLNAAGRNNKTKAVRERLADFNKNVHSTGIVPVFNATDAMMINRAKDMECGKKYGL
jgi:hypothetical protein